MGMDLYKKGLLVLCLVVLGGCRLTVAVDGAGTVTSDDGKLNCPGDCKAKLKRGKELTLTATADDGSYLASWSGCDSDDGEQCVVVGRNKNRKVTAVFAENVSLEESGVSQDLLDCAQNDDNLYTLTTPVADILKLVCNGNDGEFGQTFDAAGISALASLTYLEISHVPLTALAPVAELTRLETLKLVDVGLTEVSVLDQLNKATLESLDLQQNLDVSCADVTALETLFSAETVYAPQCASGL